MPTAGFCSECHRYVWVSHNGRCPNGHDASSVRDNHETDRLPGYTDDEVDVPVTVTAPTPPAPPQGEPGQLPEFPPPPPGHEPAGWTETPTQTIAAAGALPAGVPGFNWGAFMMPFFWSLAYGLPELALATIAANAAAVYTLITLGNQELGAVLAGLAIAIQVMIGFIGPRMYFRRNPGKLTAAEYNRKQVKWLIVGLAMLALSFFIPTP